MKIFAFLLFGMLATLLTTHVASAEKPDPIRIKGNRYFYPYNCESDDKKAKLLFYNRKIDWEFGNINGLFGKHAKPDECVPPELKGKVFNYFLSVADGESVLLHVDVRARDAAEPIAAQQYSSKAGACAKLFDFKCKLDSESMAKHSKKK